MLQRFLVGVADFAEESGGYWEMGIALQYERSDTHFVKMADMRLERFRR